MDTRYIKIKDDLLGKIKSGEYPEGSTIPTEVELAGLYGVSRPTIRRALDALARSGYLDRRKRRGTVVSNREIGVQSPVEPSSIDDCPPEIRGFGSTREKSSSSVTTMPTLVRRDVASEEVAKALNLEVGDLLFKIVLIRYFDGDPNVLTESYVNERRYPDLIEGTDFSTTGIHDRMIELGSPVKSILRKLNVINADAFIAVLLDVSEGDPLLLLHDTAYDADGNAVEYAISTYCGDGNTFEFLVIPRIPQGEQLLG